MCLCVRVWACVCWGDRTHVLFSSISNLSKQTSVFQLLLTAKKQCIHFNRRLRVSSARCSLVTRVCVRAHMCVRVCVLLWALDGILVYW